MVSRRSRSLVTATILLSDNGRTLAEQGLEQDIIDQLYAERGLGFFPWHGRVVAIGPY